MKTPLPLAWIALAALVLPVVHAGSSGSPELRDASGDVSTPGLDVVAAWWSAAPAPLFTERDVGETGVGRVDNWLAVRAPSGDRVLLTVKLNDLANAQPLVDRATSYQYRLSFTPDSWGEKIVIVCVLNYANAGASIGVLPYYDRTDIQRVGLLCAPEEGAQFEPFHADAVMDLSADTLAVTLIERDVSISVGTSFSGLQVTTQATRVTGGVPVQKIEAADTTGLGATYTFSG